MILLNTVYRTVIQHGSGCSSSRGSSTASKATMGTISGSFAWGPALVLLLLKRFVSSADPGHAARPPFYRVLVHRHFSLPWTTGLHCISLHTWASTSAISTQVLWHLFFQTAPCYRVASRLQDCVCLITVVLAHPVETKGYLSKSKLLRDGNRPKDLTGKLISLPSVFRLQFMRVPSVPV